MPLNFFLGLPSFHCSFLLPRAFSLALLPELDTPLAPLPFGPCFLPPISLGRPMRLRRSYPFSPNDDSIALDSTDLSLRPPSTWWLSMFHCAPILPGYTRRRLYNSRLDGFLLAPPLPPDNDFITFDSMALYLRPLFHPTTILQFSTRRLFPCAPLLPGGFRRLLAPPLPPDDDSIALEALDSTTFSLRPSFAWRF